MDWERPGEVKVFMETNFGKKYNVRKLWLVFMLIGVTPIYCEFGENNFYLVYDETQYHCKKYNAILKGILKRMPVNQPYFSDIVISPTSPNHEFIHDSLVSSLTKMGPVLKN